MKSLIKQRKGLEYSKILVINPFGIGDVLFTMPLVHTLKDAFPGVKLGYLCNSRSAALLKANPYIDCVFIYDRDEFELARRRSFVGWLKKLFSFIAEIKKERFDLVLDLSLNKEYGFFSWCTGIKQRVGFDYKNRGMLLTDKFPLRGYKDKHVIEYYGDLLKYFNLSLKYKTPELYIDENDKKQVEVILQKEGIVFSNDIVVIAPAGGKSWGKDAFLKHWPVTNFAALADKIIEKKQATIIIVGDNSEKELASRLVALMRGKAFNLCGMTSIGQLAALLDRARLVIANDGGPFHMAVALKKKTVSFFGPVDPVVYGPYPADNNRHAVLTSNLDCSPCYRNFRLSGCVKDKACLEGISVEEALKATLRLLQEDS